MDAHSTTFTRSRGRPPRNAALRERILDAAAASLAEPSPQPLRLRTVAQRAGVTAALLNYHFTDLDGLLQGLLRERAQPLWQALFEPPVDSASISLTRFLQRWTSAVARHRWLLPCLLQAVRKEHHGEQQWGTQLRQLVRDAQHEGSLRRDVPEDYLAMLLLSMGALPQLAATSLGRGITLAAEPAMASQLMLLHLSLLENGVRAREPQS
jgi:AcrR family transcriptional regulator